MSRAIEEFNRRQLRARDAMDRAYAQPLDIARLAGIACVSEAHFIRAFRATFGETPHQPDILVSNMTELAAAIV